MMRMATSFLSLALLALSANFATAANIEGDYIEARTADVFTGPCFSNAEIFLTGQNAVMAWKVSSGSWNGVDLSGLCVAAAINASTTLSEDRPEKASAVIIVDTKAGESQRRALVEMAKSLGGARLGHVTSVVSVRMSLKLERHATERISTSSHTESLHHGMPQSPRASFWAAGVAQIVTRPLDERDHACGNEVVAYPPISRSVHVQPAYTLGHTFQGTGLEARWSDPNCRSAFVGRFAI
jgi:hypothetical protein